LAVWPGRKHADAVVVGHRAIVIDLGITERGLVDAALEIARNKQPVDLSKNRNIRMCAPIQSGND
jgi:hypothetical protein